ncbi:MAG: hypothetical protein ACI4I3_06080 [Acutalibacteraceae bacterium]
MSVEIKVALISGGVSIFTSLLTLVGVVISNNHSKNDVQKKLEIGQAVTDTKIDELTREVREHNGFARRIPVLEEQMKVSNHRIDDLESFHKQ